MELGGEDDVGPLFLLVLSSAAEPADVETKSIISVDHLK